MITSVKKKGATWRYFAIICNDDGTPVTDFTDFNIWMTIKKADTDSDVNATAQISLGEGIEIYDSAIGKIECIFDAATTSEIEARTYVADLKVKSADDEYEYSSTFNIKCTQNITEAL